MEELLKLKENISEKMSKKLDLSLWERILKRFDKFSLECDDCKQFSMRYEHLIKELIAEQNEISKDKIKNFNNLKNEAVLHLQKQHQLVRDNYYMHTYMSLGISIGLLFGIAVFDSAGLGMPLGLAIGIAIGDSKDKEAKEKGLVI